MTCSVCGVSLGTIIFDPDYGCLCEECYAVVEPDCDYSYFVDVDEEDTDAPELHEC